MSMQQIKKQEKYQSQNSKNLRTPMVHICLSGLGSASEFLILLKFIRMEVKVIGRGKQIYLFNQREFDTF